MRNNKSQSLLKRENKSRQSAPGAISLGVQNPTLNTLQNDVWVEIFLI